MRTQTQEEALFLACSARSAVLLYLMTVEEFDAVLAGDLELEELRRRVDRRRVGREPVEPVGGSVQSRLARWSA